MAETRTTRFQMPQWSAGTDSGSRADFNEAFANIELWAARDENGTRAARPAAGIRGRYYMATDTKVIYRDNGTAWEVVGAVIEGATSIPTAASGVAQTMKGLASQTGDLMQATDSAGTVLSRIRSNGSLFVNAAGGATSHFGNGADAITGSAVGVMPYSTSTSATILRGLASQSAPIFRVQNSAATDVFTVSAAGDVAANKITVANTTPSAAGDLTSKTYVDSVFAKLDGSNNMTALNFNTATAPIRNASIGGGIDFLLSRVTTYDTTLMQLLASGTVRINGQSSGNVPLNVRAVNGGSANLQTWTDFSGVTIYASVSSNGTMTAANLTTGGIATTRFLRANSGAAADVPVTVSGASGQSGNLTEWRDSSNTLLAYINQIGSLNIGVSGGTQIWNNNDANFWTQQMFVKPVSASNRGIVVRATSSQTADLQQWQDSSNTTGIRIGPGASLHSPGMDIYSAASAATAGAHSQITIADPTYRAMVIKANATQSADLQQWQDSAGGVLARIASNGRIDTPLLRVNDTTVDDVAARITTTSDAARALVTKVTTASTARIQEWYKGASLKAYMDADGNFTAGSLNTAGNLAAATANFSGAITVGGNLNITSPSGINSGGNINTDAGFNALNGDVIVGDSTVASSRSFRAKRKATSGTNNAELLVYLTDQTTRNGGGMVLKENGSEVNRIEMNPDGTFLVGPIGNRAGLVRASTSRTNDRMHWGVATVTPNATGYATITHNAGFNPVAVAVTSQYAWVCGADPATFTNTQMQVRLLQPNGTPVTQTTTVMYVMGE